MKIKNPLVKGVVKEIKPFIYAAIIPDRYERGMLFCRHQEYYESAIKSIKGKYISFENFMNTYRKVNKHNSFIYTEDWAGYNIPSHILEKSNNLFYKETEYDKIMNDIYFYCTIDAQNKNNGTSHKWYLISAEKETSSLMYHEIAHGLYYTNKEYYNSCQVLLNDMKPSVYELVKKKLIKMQYGDDKKIIPDEIQAYLSTGLYPSMKTKAIEGARKPFIKNFKKFLKTT
jgi:hypothetical protein